MKFSIILPVRNGGEYVKKCVQSIIAQTYTGFNLHILENCSTDGTAEWLRTLNDERIIIIPSDRPLGIEENWGRIISIPKNEYMTMIGHDDVLDRSYLEVMNDLIKQYPDASLYQTHFRYIDGKGKFIRSCKKMDERQNAAEFLAAFLQNKIDINGTGFMMRSEDYDAAGGIPSYPSLLFADFELWIRLTARCYMATSTKECFSFRIHRSTTSISADLKLHQAFAQFIKYLKNLKQESATFESVILDYAIPFVRFWCKGLTHRLLRTPKDKRNNLCVSLFLKQCKKYADELAPGNNFDPVETLSLRLAQKIDHFAITRSLFLAFKKIYSKPVLSA